MNRHRSRPRLVQKAKADSEEELLNRAALQLNGKVLGVVMGAVCCAGLFVATNWLVIKGGVTVGSHLGLLSQFFKGYSVTFHGSLVGTAYAFLCGYIGGWGTASIYNKLLKARRS